VSCADAQGTRHFVVGFGNDKQKQSQGWCLTTVVFHIVTGSDTEAGSTFGTARLTVNGRVIRQYTCSPPAPCQNDVEKPFNTPRYIPAGAVLAYEYTCGVPEDPASLAQCAADPRAFKATITVSYERADGP